MSDLFFVSLFRNLNLLNEIQLDLYGIDDEDEFIEERAKAMQDTSAQRYFDVRRVKYPAHLALGDIDRTFLFLLHIYLRLFVLW